MEVNKSKTSNLVLAFSVFQEIRKMSQIGDYHSICDIFVILLSYLIFTALAFDHPEYNFVDVPFTFAFL